MQQIESVKVPGAASKSRGKQDNRLIRGVFGAALAGLQVPGPFDSKCAAIASHHNLSIEVKLVPKLEVGLCEVDQDGLESGCDSAPIWLIDELLDLGLLQEVYHELVPTIVVEPQPAGLPLRHELEDAENHEHHLQVEVVRVEVEQRQVQHGSCNCLAILFMSSDFFSDVGN